MLAGHDLASGQLFYRLRDRRHSQEFGAFLRQLGPVPDRPAPHRL
jgi:hypothetical protein